jgi:hypothetical protein
MHSMTAAQAEQQLTDLADQFAHWRQDRTYRFAPIPLSLWEQAIALTTVLPLASVAKRLRLRGRDLQKRCAARHQTPEGTPAQALSGSTLPALGFVEVPAAPVWPRPPVAIEIELHRPDGTRLRIAAQEPQLPLLAVVQAFLETSSCSS